MEEQHISNKLFMCGASYKLSSQGTNKVGNFCWQGMIDDKLYTRLAKCEKYASRWAKSVSSKLLIQIK